MEEGSNSTNGIRLYYNKNACGKNGEIYCHGQLLHTVQMARIYPDSKTFVDMKMKNGPEETLSRFNAFISTNNQPSQEEIKRWVEENFDPPGSEFEPWIPSDWKKNPAILSKVNDGNLKEFASDLNNIWLELGRKMSSDVANNPNNYSIIHVDHPVIVPGGRFLEFYYWDSYWIIRGLLISEMYSTAKGMLQNFLQIVQRFGFIPNGGRVYYSMRSQPPLLSAMIKTYVDTTKDYEFAKSSVATLESEFNFFMENHTTTVNGHKLAKYGDNSYGPRPESYREDVLTGESFNTEEERQEHYSELKAAAESGMDFSSRWFINDDGTNVGDLTHLKTRSIIPVDLNAILHWNAKIIAEFYEISGNGAKAKEFEDHAEALLVGLNAVLWDEEAGSWLDYDMINSKRRNYFVPTNLFPLWMNCYPESKRAHITEKILQYIENEKLDDHPGGVPNTLQHTGEQWDFPNVWPPMQHVLIVGLHNLNDERTKSLASKWATRWVRSNYLAYQDQKAMYEKYLATVLGGHGGGGEYEVQKGFGWSNGVVLDLLERYGATLTPSDKDAGTPIKAFGVVATLVIALFMTTMAAKIFG